MNSETKRRPNKVLNVFILLYHQSTKPLVFVDKCVLYSAVFNTNLDFRCKSSQFSSFPFINGLVFISVTRNITKCQSSAKENATYTGKSSQIVKTFGSFLFFGFELIQNVLVKPTSVVTCALGNGWCLLLRVNYDLPPACKVFENIHMCSNDKYSCL